MPTRNKATMNEKIPKICICPIQYGYYKEYFKMNVFKKICVVHSHNYNSSNAMQVTTIENEIVQQ